MPLRLKRRHFYLMNVLDFVSRRVNRGAEGAENYALRPLLSSAFSVKITYKYLSSITFL